MRERIAVDDRGSEFARMPKTDLGLERERGIRLLKYALMLNYQLLQLLLFLWGKIRVCLPGIGKVRPPTTRWIAMRE
jgi:hypothetical protein